MANFAQIWFITHIVFAILVFKRLAHVLPTLFYKLFEEIPNMRTKKYANIGKGEAHSVILRVNVHFSIRKLNACLQIVNIASTLNGGFARYTENNLQRLMFYLRLWCSKKPSKTKKRVKACENRIWRFDYFFYSSPTYTYKHAPIFQKV